MRVRLSERECLARAMYFESNRSSDAGMLAVGTVVMNRLKSGRYGSTVCQVVGAPKQFAPGVLTRPMTDRGAPRARRMADIVLSGKRHPGVQNAQFFHTYGYRYPYKNMRYVLVAGGNAFYDKTKAPKTWWGGEGRWPGPPTPSESVGGAIMVASNEVVYENDRAPEPPLERAPRAEAREAPAREQIATRRAVERTEVAVRAEPQPRRGARVETRMADAGEVPIYEPAPTRKPMVVASLEKPRPEDRWRDEELAADAGQAPASNKEWRDRREEVQIGPRVPDIEKDDPAAHGWRAGPAPVRTGSIDREIYGSPEPEDTSYALSRAGDQALAETPRPAVARPAPRPRTVAPKAPIQASAAGGWNGGYDAEPRAAAPRRSDPAAPARRRSAQAPAAVDIDELLDAEGPAARTRSGR